MIDSGMPGFEMRVIRLEESSYFQEERLKALDGQLLAQQKQIDEMERAIKSLEAKLERLEANNDVFADGRPGHELPPHYQQKNL